jgi:hypothetical protein
VRGCRSLLRLHRASGVVVSAWLPQVLVKVQPDGKYVVDVDAKEVDIAKCAPNTRVALRHDSYTLHKILPTKVDPLVSLMRVEKVPDSSYDMVGGLDKQIQELKEVRRRRAGVSSACGRPTRHLRWGWGVLATDSGIGRSHDHRISRARSFLLRCLTFAFALMASRAVAGTADVSCLAPSLLLPRCAERRSLRTPPQVIELPIKHPELFDSLGVAQPKVRVGVRARASANGCPLPPVDTLWWLPVSPPSLRPSLACHRGQGVLMYGPPGTGKTLLARAVAHHTDCQFIRVSGAELVQKYIGEGSRMVRELFVMARCVHVPRVLVPSLWRRACRASCELRAAARLGAERTRRRLFSWTRWTPSVRRGLTAAGAAVTARCSGQ